jgi:hypothetical protein
VWPLKILMTSTIGITISLRLSFENKFSKKIQDCQTQ